MFELIRTCQLDIMQFLIGASCLTAFFVLLMANTGIKRKNSENGEAGGPGFKEFALMRMDGEGWETHEGVVTRIDTETPKIYAALSGDQCALTGIRIKRA